MKKIGMLLFRYPLGNSPSLINSAILLAREGYEVHIFIERVAFEHSRINFDNQNIVIHIIDIRNTIFGTYLSKKKILVFHNGKLKKIPVSSIFGSIYTILINMVYKLHLLYDKKVLDYFSKQLHYYIKHLFKDLFEFYKKTLGFIDDKYVCLFGVDTLGLLASTLIVESQRLRRIPVIYYNLELLLEKECNSPVDRVLKSLEREGNRRSFMTIIQDKRRAKHLIDDNDISEEKIVYVPVSALGDAHKEKSDYLHKTLNIPKDKKIVLYAGNIIPWAMCLEIAEAAQNWNNDNVLVLHTWRTDSDNDPYIKEIRDLTKNKKVHLSLNPVEWQKLPELLSSADIGIIFYQNLGENFYETGSSSNKIASYLQVGLPVITSDYPSFREIIERYKCGKCGKDPDEIEKLSKEIFLDYDTYRNNAFKCYKERYEFSKYFKSVIDKIKSIS